MKFIKFFTIIIFFTAFIPGAAMAAVNYDVIFERGLSAYNEKDFKKAETYWKRAAGRGHVSSMYSLGRLYESGNLGKPDLDEAAHWYENAAEHGAAPAQYFLGKILYDKGDYDGAYKWISEAAKADYDRAQHDLALMYEEGKGVQQSMEEAAAWYIKAAENGFAPAQFRLVLMYMRGNGVDKNNEQAFQWATRASESGDPNAKYLLGYMYYSGTGTVQSLEMATIWLEEAIAEGQPKAKKLLEEVQKKQKQQVSAL